MTLFILGLCAGFLAGALVTVWALWMVDLEWKWFRFKRWARRRKSTPDEIAEMALLNNSIGPWQELEPTKWVTEYGSGEVENIGWPELTGREPKAPTGVAD